MPNRSNLPGRVVARIRRALFALASLGRLLPSAAAASSPDDAEVFAMIESLRIVAAGISVDGDCSEWGAIPLFADPVGDAGGDPTRDVVGVALAPTDAELFVRIDVAGTPPTGADDYWLEVDYRNQQYWDLTFSLASGFAFFDVRPEAGESGGGRLPWTSAHQIAAGASCIEVRIPFADLETQLPPAMQGQLTGAAARSWLRVHAMTGEPLEFFATEIDYGVAVGSFRLAPTPYDLDPALPAGAVPAYRTGFPLLGDWYLGQGTGGTGSHGLLSEPWAYDWHKVDHALEPETPERSGVLTDNYSFGEPIFTPEGGTAGSGSGHVDDQPDCTPYQACPPGAGVNNLFLELPNGFGLLFSHMVQGSLLFASGAAVPEGAQIGEVGNSGSAWSWPHLHHEVRDRGPDPDVRIPISLAQVDVGLNPDLENDPWRRRFAVWHPREGFFARRSPVPLPGPGGIAWVLAAGLIATGAAMIRRPNG